MDITTQNPSRAISSKSDAPRRRYRYFLLLVAGLGGLLYGIDIGIIGGALPYLEATSGLNAAQLSIIVAAVLLGSVLSTLFAGMLADWIGRRRLMILSGLAFDLSIPVIALSHGYSPLFFGRLLQGISGGLIGIVVPLYLAECLPPEERGRGTGAFQWLLTLGIVAAALMGIFYSYRVEDVVRTSAPAVVLAYKNQAWRRIFWLSMPPGLLFVAGSILVADSPRWLFRAGKYQQAKAALMRSRSEELADLEMYEMESLGVANVSSAAGNEAKSSLLSRKYVIPFTLACVVLFCNTATGVNSIIGYNTGILLQSGLSDVAAHWGYVILTIVNFVMTMFGMLLVDRIGRKPLFLVGTIGIACSLATVGTLFLSSETHSIDRPSTLQAMIGSDQALSVRFTASLAQKLLSASQDKRYEPMDVQRVSLVVVYSCGDFTVASTTVRSNEGNVLEISRNGCVPQNWLDAALRNPFGSLDQARASPLKIKHATIRGIPATEQGWLVAVALDTFMAFFAVGPGVCVWLALTELMPARIRSNGMSVALVINQLVSTIFAGIFLPFVSRYGYSTIFFIFAGFSLIYMATTLLFLPETKGKTLEEIEKHFQTGRLERV